MRVLIFTADSGGATYTQPELTSISFPLCDAKDHYTAFWHTYIHGYLLHWWLILTGSPEENPNCVPWAIRCTYLYVRGRMKQVPSVLPYNLPSLTDSPPWLRNHLPLRLYVWPMWIYGHFTNPIFTRAIQLYRHWNSNEQAVYRLPPMGLNALTYTLMHLVMHPLVHLGMHLVMTWRQCKRAVLLTRVGYCKDDDMQAIQDSPGNNSINLVYNSCTYIRVIILSTGPLYYAVTEEIKNTKLMTVFNR